MISGCAARLQLPGTTMPTDDGDRTVAALLDAALTEQQERLLRAILWPVVAENRAEDAMWSQWHSLRRGFGREGFGDAQAAFDTLPVLDGPHGPYGLVWRTLPGAGRQIRSDERVGLTVAGLHRADPHHDHERASRLAQLIALLGDQEARASLNPDQVITRTIELRDMAASYLKLTDPGTQTRSMTLRAAVHLLGHEPVPITVDWDRHTVVIGDGHLEPYRDVSTAREYLAALVRNANLHELPAISTTDQRVPTQQVSTVIQPVTAHVLGGPGYELAWPKDVGVAELLAVAQRPRHGAADRARLLLSEIFATAVPSDDLAAYLADASSNEDEAAQHFLWALVQVTDQFPEGRSRPPYYGQDTAAEGIDIESSWRRIVVDFRMAGYLEQAAPEGCGDDPPPREQNDRLNSITRERIGLRHVWPITTMRVAADPIPTEDFYRLVELVGDLVARPRSRQEHAGCGWHYLEFAPEPARSLYRARLNELFDRTGVPLRMSDQGEDRGRLVRVTGDARDQLVRRALAVQDDGDRADVAHAVRRFRDRAATRDDKRAAVVALARVLENHRELLKDEMLSRDEGALFNIANNFDVRHRGADQRADYDEFYLDWLFWWYLATVELIDRLITRKAAATG